MMKVCLSFAFLRSDGGGGGGGASGGAAKTDKNIAPLGSHTKLRKSVKWLDSKLALECETTMCMVHLFDGLDRKVE